MRHHHARKSPADEVNGGVHASYYMRFAIWMLAQKTRPTWRAVAAEFGVSRATSYRLLAAFDEVVESMP